MIDAFGLSNQGFIRDNNEDVFEAKHFDDLDIMVVCDGLGGLPAGEVASRLALGMFMNEFNTRPHGDVPDLINRGIEAANSAVFAASNSTPDYKGMGSTLTGAVVKGQYAYIFNIGDSRTYLLHGTKLTQETEDDNVKNQNLKLGLDSFYGSENDAAITKTIGFSAFVETDIILKRMYVGDRLLVCSDGLHGMVPDLMMTGAMIVGSVEESARKLESLAMRIGGTDNCTLIVGQKVPDATMKMTLPVAAIT